MKNETVKKILQETEIGYDMMSQKFSETRKFFWRGMEFIGDYAKDGDNILDFGCGNGRLVELFSNKNIKYFGVDVSQKLIDIAKNKYPDEGLHFQKISGSDSLAFADNFFNSVYSIAVFHHLPKEQAKKMAQELFRITKSDGHIIITAWNLYQKNYIKNIFKNWLGKLVGESELDWKGCYISFKNNEGKIFQRYHHAYTKKELKNIFSRVGFIIEKCEMINKRNIVLIARKK